MVYKAYRGEVYEESPALRVLLVLEVRIWVLLGRSMTAGFCDSSREWLFMPRLLRAGMVLRGAPGQVLSCAVVEERIEF